VAAPGLQVSLLVVVSGVATFADEAPNPIATGQRRHPPPPTLRRPPPRPTSGNSRAHPATPRRTRVARIEPSASDAARHRPRRCSATSAARRSPTEHQRRFSEEGREVRGANCRARRQATTSRFAYTFGVEPLQQYLIAFPDGRLQSFTSRGTRAPRRTAGQRWFNLYSEREDSAARPAALDRSPTRTGTTCAPPATRPIGRRATTPARTATRPSDRRDASPARPVTDRLAARRVGAPPGAGRSDDAGRGEWPPRALSRGAARALGDGSGDRQTRDPRRIRRRRSRSTPVHRATCGAA